MRRTALLLCVAHLALPAALRAAGRRAGRGSALRAIGDRTDVAYDAGTVALAAAAAFTGPRGPAALATRPGRSAGSAPPGPDGCGTRPGRRNERHTRRGRGAAARGRGGASARLAGAGRRGVTVLVAALAGAALPGLVRSLAGDGRAPAPGRAAAPTRDVPPPEPATPARDGGTAGPATPARTVRPARAVVRAARTALCAAAEETLWRVAAPGALRATGVPARWASTLAGAGFVMLHAGAGLRGTPYHVLTTALFTAAHAAGGPAAAAACHAAHNLTLEHTPPLPQRPEPAPVATPPSRRSW